MSDPIQVVVIFTPAPDKTNQLKDHLLAVVDKVHTNEPGVLKYQMFEQIDSRTGVNVVLFQETYADQEAVNIHLSSEYFKAFGATVQEEGLLAKDFEIIVVKPIGGWVSR